MNAVEHPHRFQFNHNDFLDQRIRGIFSDHGVTLAYDDAVLLRHREADLAQFARQGILVNRLRES